ncbi:glycosyltransferase [Rouxiella silvae]|uniref:Glycosyltransferase n=1 Tax=Rouxiella silvae TaxID=1646373 RepID=A0AA40X6T6_9GAMM|nr:glycosyltransferase [Rouxiella silvae]MBF6639565.1 glycosyltransferase [Rouxiella silvae]
MRILFVIDGLPGGGAEKVVLTLAEGLLQQGHHVSLFSLRDVCQYSLPAGLDYRVIKDQSRSPWRKLTELSRRAAQLDKVLRKTDAFDLVLSNLHKTDRIVAKSRVLDFKKVWFCLHGMFSTSYLGHRTGFDRWLKQRKIKSVYHNRNVVAVSRAVANDIEQQFGLRLSQLEVIYNPFDTDAIRAAGEQPCEMAGQPYLIHVGRFHENKRHDRLIEAYAKSGVTAPLLLLGQGKPEQTEKLKALAEKFGVAERVIFKGFQSNPYPYVRHASQLILSSDSEGFGNVLVEALLLDTPAVSTRCPGGPAEILTGELARGLADLNAAALADTIKDIYNNPPEIDQQQLSHFGIVPICEQYAALATSKGAKGEGG